VTASGLVLPPVNPRSEKYHWGRVVRMGAPAEINGHHVEPGFQVGDVVMFVYALALQKRRDFGDVIWIGQEEVQGVLCEGALCDSTSS
jgi:co-chaperonin GroES (HSP10)